MRTLLYILFFVSSVGYAQTKEYKNLVFEGAGIRGIAYAGVIEELEKKQVLSSIERVGGTSAGAITALAISLGYGSKDVQRIIGETNFNQFNEGSVVKGFSRIKNHYGWYKGDQFEQWVSEIIKTKTGKSNITFKELHEAGFKDLYVVATCLNRQKMLVFSEKTYPMMKVIDAIRISMSIPLYFEAVYIDSAGKVIKDPKNTNGLDLVVDGGIIGNFPITIFDSIVIDSMGNKTRVINTQTLGVRIDSDEQIEQDMKSQELAMMPVNDFKSYIEALYVIIIENLNRNQLTKSDWDRTISVSSKKIGPKVKKLSDEEKKLLIESGRESVTRFFK